MNRMYNKDVIQTNLPVINSQINLATPIPYSFFYSYSLKLIKSQTRKKKMLTNTIRFMFALHSKNLVKSNMLLRPEHQRYVGLHPQKAQKYVKATQAPEPLAFKIHPAFQNTSFDLPHPKPLGLIEKLPFSVQRSLSGNLPVYVDYKNRRNIKRTIVRKITGDIEQLANQLRKVCSNAEVRVKVGHIVIPGIHKESVNMLLYRLGL